jgi:hypothetical protein
MLLRESRQQSLLPRVLLLPLLHDSGRGAQAIEGAREMAHTERLVQVIALFPKDTCQEETFVRSPRFCQHHLVSLGCCL